MTIDTYLKRSGNTKRELANALGVAPWTLERYLSGRVPAPAIVVRLYEVTHGAVEPNDLYELPELQ